MGFLSFLFEDTDNNKKDKNAGLDNWQKKEIKKGNYAPYNFEEEELEDDDYYFEDEE
jgi:hypothetical protein